MTKVLFISGPVGMGHVILILRYFVRQMRKMGVQGRGWEDEQNNRISFHEF
ncbi:MAG: hypothetical protein ISF22_09075 [Methanomassiliicoccus sp.]|nr:hypothetical protein [Methanomassiliicoccus sp.]